MELKRLASWKDISLRQYIALYALKMDDDFELMLKQIQIIYGISESDVDNISIQDFQLIKEDIRFLSDEPQTTDIKKEIIVDGIVYRLKENLADIKLGEWMDMESFNNDSINNLHKIIALLYRKEGLDKYIPSEVDEAAELFLDNVDIETCLAAFFLFYLFALNYIPSDIQDCSMFQKAEMEIQKMKMELQKNQSKEPLAV